MYPKCIHKYDLCILNVSFFYRLNKQNVDRENDIDTKDVLKGR